jgi:hypothetical protein
MRQGSEESQETVRGYQEAHERVLLKIQKNALAEIHKIGWYDYSRKRFS